MVGPIRRKTNFHSIADLAVSDCSPYRVPPHHPHIPNIPTLKVRMEPSPSESLLVTSPSFSTPSRPVAKPVRSATHDSPQSPAISEDSGLGHELTTPILIQHSDEESHTNISPDEDSQSDRLRKYRKQRTVFEADQLKALEDTFAVNAYPSSEEYESLADRINIDEARLRIWFQNRRARYRRSSKHCPTAASPPSNLSLHIPNFSTPVSAAVPRLPQFTPSQMMLLGAHPLFYGSGY